MEQPNIEYIIKLSGNDDAIKHNLIKVMKYELPLEIDAYFECIHANKMKHAALCVHKLKHKIGILGLEENYHLAQQYEDELRKNEKKSQIEFEKILNLIQNFVNCL